MPLPRLYAILDVTLTEARGLAPDTVFNAWLDAGVRLIQLRAKTVPSDRLLAFAETFATRAKSAGALFIVNDRADIARWSEASGLHVGQDDLAPDDARRLVPRPALLGLSTHTEAQVVAALDQPVDYLAIGPVFPTVSKERPDPVVGLEGVRRAAALARAHYQPRPLVAIGGIDRDRAVSVIEAGADTVAVISALLAPDLAGCAKAWLQTLEQARP